MQTIDITLDFAIVTHTPAGINRVASMILPPCLGVRYVISWQDHEDCPVPPALLRPDVEVHRFDGKGISANRNNALDNCTSEIILFSDDDLTYNPQLLGVLRAIFQTSPEVDVATFISEHGDMSRFPSEAVTLGRKLPKGYSVASFEIALRRSTAGMLRCCPELGIGSERFHGGEDELFLASAIRRGLRCRFFPLPICSHPHESTGTKGVLTAGNLKASGLVIALTEPVSAVIRVPLKAWRVYRQGKASLWSAIKNLTVGALHAPAFFRRNRTTLW